MKKHSILILYIQIMILVPAALAARELGDVNNNGTIDIVDALITTQSYVGLKPPGFNPAVADTSGDGEVTIVDALMIAQYYVGVLSEFPGAGRGLRLEYLCYEPAAEAKTLKPRFRIVNNSSNPLELGNMKIRYWYTKEAHEPEVFTSPYAAIGQEHLSGEFLYGCLEISIASQAGSLEPGTNTGNINITFHTENYGFYTQPGDYSFNPDLTSFTEWEKVTLLYNGFQVWGTDPYGNGPGSYLPAVPAAPPLPTPLA